MGVLNELQHVVSFATIKKSDVSVYSENGVGKAATLVPVTGASWKDMVITAGTGIFKQVEITGDMSGTYVETSFSVSVPVKEVEYPDIAQEGPVYCRIGFSDNKYLVVQPVILGHSYDSSKGEVLFSFSRKSVYGAMLLL